MDQDTARQLVQSVRNEYELDIMRPIVTPTRAGLSISSNSVVADVGWIVTAHHSHDVVLAFMRGELTEAIINLNRGRRLDLCSRADKVPNGNGWRVRFFCAQKARGGGRSASAPSQLGQRNTSTKAIGNCECLLQLRCWECYDETAPATGTGSSRQVAKAAFEERQAKLSRGERQRAPFGIQITLVKIGHSGHPKPLFLPHIVGHAEATLIGQVAGPKGAHMNAKSRRALRRIFISNNKAITGRQIDTVKAKLRRSNKNEAAPTGMAELFDEIQGDETKGFVAVLEHLGPDGQPDGSTLIVGSQPGQTEYEILDETRLDPSLVRLAKKTSWERDIEMGHAACGQPIPTAAQSGGPEPAVAAQSTPEPAVTFESSVPDVVNNGKSRTNDVTVQDLLAAGKKWHLPVLVWASEENIDKVRRSPYYFNIDASFKVENSGKKFFMCVGNDGDYKSFVWYRAFMQRESSLYYTYVLLAAAPFLFGSDTLRLATSFMADGNTTMTGVVMYGFLLGIYGSAEAFQQLLCTTHRLVINAEEAYTSKWRQIDAGTFNMLFCWLLYRLRFLQSQVDFLADFSRIRKWLQEQSDPALARNYFGIQGYLKPNMHSALSGFLELAFQHVSPGNFGLRCLY
jgi:hypothetical protein